MSWIESTFKTYNNNLDKIGKPTYNRFGWDAPMLLPVAHTTQKVNIQIDLNEDGDLIYASILRKDEMTTIIPCTEESSARTSGPVPHPLVDKLQYIAGDYKKYGGPKESQYEAYMDQLKDWCDSKYGNGEIRAVYKYLKKGRLIEDLIARHILIAGEDGKLLKKWTGAKEDAPEIFRNLSDQFEAFVRYRVGDIRLHDEKEIWDSFTDYYISTLNKTGICYVQGKEMPLSALSPYKIRNSGDRAKLISSNDNTNFTYRGRFKDAEEALSIGYETTQKAHSALRWLIGKQGTLNGDQAIVCWSAGNEPVPQLMNDTVDLIRENNDIDIISLIRSEKPSADTRAAFAMEFNKAIAGYRGKLVNSDYVSVMILDSATPGRMSIRYYRELTGSKLMNSIEDWHKHFTWELIAKKESEKNSGKFDTLVRFYGAPSPKEIAEAAYGSKVDAKLKQNTIERILPCISEMKIFPRDIMLSAVRRASNGIAMEPWEANKTRNIACALICGYYHRNKKEEYSMAVDEICKDRSYLFGRILACANRIEELSNYYTNDTSGDGSKRPTNALRYEVAFTQRPAKTLEILRRQTMPYLENLIKNGRSTYANDLMLKLIDRIPADEFNNEPLSELYMLGYASQRAEFMKKSNSKEENDNDNEE